MIKPTTNTGQNQNIKSFIFFPNNKKCYFGAQGDNSPCNGLLFVIQKLFNAIKEFLHHRIPDKISDQLARGFFYIRHNYQTRAAETRQGDKSPRLVG